ncbi:MAG TPA: M23 family metallopeptidase [Bryobacteraceae bacterium]|nr:M23 family metallopeptidase [Bryobacteraceae bacterium]
MLSISLLLIGFVTGFYLGLKSNADILKGQAPPPGERPSAFDPQQAKDEQMRARIKESNRSAEQQLIEKPKQTSTIGLPIKGLKRDAIMDTFDDKRGTDRKHEATDIMAPRGTPVLAVVDGTIKKLFHSVPGGLTIYLFDNNEQHGYYYAHLDGYAAGLKEGQKVRRGDVIGYVGTTGNAPQDAPHLHFAMFELGPEKDWWRGTPINPYNLLVEAWESEN